MMVVGPHTRIAALVKHNEASIDAIASLAKPLRKLRNPLLRRVMASRVTIAEAASIGGCELADFARVLEPLGFVFANGTPTDKEDQPDRQPVWLHSASPTQVTHIDVRPIIASGGDPLQMILKRYKALSPGELLCVINSFVPYPLIKLLEEKGAQCFTERMGDSLHHTWFLNDPTAKADVTKEGNVTLHGEEGFSALLTRFDTSCVRHIDVRPLPMPLPMETILENLPALQPGEVLLVSHKRIPLYLLEELADADYAIHIYEAGEGDVRLLIQPTAHA